MDKLFKPSRVEKESLMKLVTMMATVEHFYHESDKEDTLLDLQAHLSDGRNFVRLDSSNAIANKFNPLTLAMLQLRNEIAKLPLIQFYDKVGAELPAEDVHTSDVTKLPAFKALAAAYLKIAQTATPQTFQRHALLSEFLLELRGDRSADLIRRFKTLKEDPKQAKFLVENIYTNRPEITGITNKKL